MYVVALGEYSRHRPFFLFALCFFFPLKFLLLLVVSMYIDVVTDTVASVVFPQMHPLTCDTHFSSDFPSLQPA